MSEKSTKPPMLDPVAELAEVFARQSANLQPTLDVEQYRYRESHSARARRLGRRAVHGKYSGAAMKPARYNVAGYVDNVAKSIDDLIAETGKFPESLYDVAETAAAMINREKREYSYFSDDPQGVEAVGLLKAITSRPAFIKSPRAEDVLSRLGQATYQVCNENMFTENRYGHQPKMKDGYDVGFTEDFARIATSDVLWDKLQNGGDTSIPEVKWPLIRAATALQVLAVNHPGATQEARLEVLKKNEVSGSGLTELNYHLVYSFNTDKEKAFLAAAAAKDERRGVGTTIAQDILDGKFENVRWAI